MPIKRNKANGEFFEFRFHEIILGLALTALPAWLVRQARIFGFPQPDTGFGSFVNS